MRSYGQLCGLAKALDVVGDRWTLLIVRELLIRDACRYTDLKNGLPGIATNLLALRLDELVDAGVIVREEAPPPIATTVFRLTDRGRSLEPVIEALGQWGRPLVSNPTGDETFRGHWLALPLRYYVRDRTPDAPRVTLEVRTGDEPVIVETVGDGSLSTRVGRATHADATLEGPPGAVLGVLSGRLDLASARRNGLHYRGDPRLVRRFAGADAADALPRAAGPSSGRPPAARPEPDRRPPRSTRRAAR